LSVQDSEEYPEKAADLQYGRWDDDANSDKSNDCENGNRQFIFILQIINFTVLYAC
jgi:hypothetical protein